jgi:large subunit ribosomal protein L32
MTPLPKRRHTHARTGLRKNAATNKLSIPSLAKCANCGELKYPHTACSFCGKYKSEAVTPKEA